MLYPVNRELAVDRTSTGVPGLDAVIEGGFPANRVSEVKGIIDPTTAEA